MEKTKVSASIVLYGDLEKARECIRSLLEYTKGVELALYVVDNQSPDHAGEVLKAEFKDRVNFILLPQNIGFGRGHNLVLPNVYSRYHAVINPDIRIEEDALTAMAAYLDRNPEVVMTTPRLYYPDGREQFVPRRRPTVMALLGRQLHGPFKNYENYYLMRDQDMDETQQITFCTGCFFMARTETLKEVGGFDENYFLYVEDADLTQRMLAAGRVTYWPGTKVYHCWSRKPRHEKSHFRMQLRSMRRYFHNWGWKSGFGQSYKMPKTARKEKKK